MFNNIGSKIKAVAKFICYAGISLSIIGGMIMLVVGVISEPSVAISGLVIMTVGSVCSWLGSLTTYGLGELIENTTVIAELMAKADAEKNNA